MNFLGDCGKEIIKRRDDRCGRATQDEFGMFRGEVTLHMDLAKTNPEGCGRSGNEVNIRFLLQGGIFMDIIEFSNLTRLWK